MNDAMRKTLREMAVVKSSAISDALKLRFLKQLEAVLARQVAEEDAQLDALDAKNAPVQGAGAAKRP